MKPFLMVVLAVVLATGVPRSAHAQTVKTYTSKAAFIADTAATSATDALPDVGMVVNVAVDPLGTYTLGSLTFGLTAGGDDISIGASGTGAAPDWYPETPDNEMALGFERMQVSTAGPVFSFGFDFIEPAGDVPWWAGVPEESDYEILLFNGPALVGQATFAGSTIPNNVVTFLGVWSDRPFDRVVINDTSGNDDDEYFGEFFTGTTPFGCTLALDLSYAAGTLTMNFELGSATAATWNVWFAYGTTSLVPLWSVPIPAITPAVTFPLAFPLSPLQGVGVLTTLNTPGQGIVCSAFKVVTAAP